MFNNVDLPAPFPPDNPILSPLFIVKLNPCKTSWPELLNFISSPATDGTSLDMLAVLSTFPTACFAGVTPLRRQRVDRVAVVGGTHGNELLGVQIVNQLLRQPDEAERSTFETVCVIANPEAVVKNRRYCTVDLNRCFDATTLQASHGRRAEGVEPARARVRFFVENDFCLSEIRARQTGGQITLAHNAITSSAPRAHTQFNSQRHSSD